MPLSRPPWRKANGLPRAAVEVGITRRRRRRLPRPERLARGRGASSSQDRLPDAVADPSRRVGVDQQRAAAAEAEVGLGRRRRAISPLSRSFWTVEVEERLALLDDLDDDVGLAAGRRGRSAGRGGTSGPRRPAQPVLVPADAPVERLCRVPGPEELGTPSDRSRSSSATRRNPSGRLAHLTERLAASQCGGQAFRLHPLVGATAVGAQVPVVGGPGPRRGTR